MLTHRFTSRAWHRGLRHLHANRSLIATLCSRNVSFHSRSSSTLAQLSAQRDAAVKYSRSSKEPISEAQRRSAQLELEQMTQSTSRLLAITDSTLITDAIVNEARVALHYWSRRWYMHYHPGFGRAAKGSALSFDALRNSSFGPPHEALRVDNSETDSPSHQKSGDYGARQAEILLDWSISHNLVNRGIFNLEGILSPLDYDHNEDYGCSPNMTFSQIIDTYLLPCAYNGVGSFGNYSNEEQINLLVEENNQRHYATLSKHFTRNLFHIKAVVDATRVLKKMREVQAAFSDYISADTLSIKSELNVWSKRSMILGVGHAGAQTGGILAGNIVAGHLNNINANDTLKSLEAKDPLDEHLYTLEGCIQEMENILVKAEERYTSTHDDSIKPSVEWYNHLLASYGRSDLKDASIKAKRMLRGMEAYEDNLDEDRDNSRSCWAKPDLISYNSLLFCLARDGSEARSKEALELFEKLKRKFERTHNESIRPDEVTYGSVLHALAQVGMAHDAQAILDTIEEDESVTPSLTIYNTVLNAYANSFERGAPRRAEMLLDRMKNLSSTGENPDIEPDIVSISTVMACHARSRKRANAIRAEELLDEAIKSYSLGNAKMKPDSIMFNCAILAWAQCSSTARDEWDRCGRLLEPPAERAEMLLHKLLDLSRSGTLEIAPVAQTVNLVLDGWAKSARKDAGDRALRLMRDMPNFGVTADECSYNSVLNAMSKQGDAQSIEKALTIFRELQTLSSSGENGRLTISDLSYNVMITVYGRSDDKDGARHAESLLRSMEDNGVQPTIITYNSCIDAYARRGDVANAESLIDEMEKLSEQGKKYLRPTIHSFAALINAIANSRASDSIDRAEEIVSRVEALDYVKPNTVLYNSLINTIVKSGNRDSSARADQVLKRMERAREAGNTDIEPDSFAYSMVLTLCARSREPDAAVRASNILDSMEELHAQGRNVIANSRCYSAVITAWARSGSPEAVNRAFNLINRMEQNRRNGSPHGVPNAHCYNSCIHTIAKSSEKDKVKYCLDILDRMNRAKEAGDLDSAPTVVTYSTIVNACAFTTGNDEERKKAFDLARSCLLTLLESKDLEPDDSIFANIFLVITRHLGVGEARDRFSEAVFKEACKRGMVDKQVLYRFRNASSSAAKRLLPDYPSDSILRDWGTNAGKYRRKT